MYVYTCMSIGYMASIGKDIRSYIYYYDDQQCEYHIKIEMYIFDGTLQY